ncbi:MAG: hypothetical protein OEV89_10610 [Desulfobulbaceae bacterium]|nr:hypothetical protein [Desulfobulbaceae bacterium]HIJ91139.1 hypothetical protein [Deltaproteobacteria bacterium]
MHRLPNIHSGEILRKKYLNPMEIRRDRLAKAIGVPAIPISEICAKKRSVFADIAGRKM